MNFKNCKYLWLLNRLEENVDTIKPLFWQIHVAAVMKTKWFKIIVVKYVLDELFKRAELNELFEGMNEVFPNF